MNLDRLAVLLELSRSGSMRAVAERLRSSTSAVSQQIATLAREVGVPLIEPDGRNVRLTPAGRQLAAHAVTILAAVQHARHDLQADAAPHGTIRVAGYASAAEHTLLPITTELAQSHPAVRVALRELEPDEAHAALLADHLDLALGYDYDLVPMRVDPGVVAQPLGHAAWGLAVPAARAPREPLTAPQLFARFADSPWIGNSRNAAEAALLRTVAALGGFEPRVEHLADSLELVEGMVGAGLAVGLLPMGRPLREGLVLLPLREPEVRLRTFVWTRRGSERWPPLRLFLQRLHAHAATARAV